MPLAEPPSSSLASHLSIFPLPFQISLTVIVVISPQTTRPSLWSKCFQFQPSFRGIHFSRAYMSKSRGFRILDAQDAAAVGDEAEVASKPCPKNASRRKLADISNLQQKQCQEDKSQCIPVTTTKEYIEKLQKDNIALANILAQRNKMIAEKGTELERLRVNLIKAQEQNRQLAISNTQLLAELNTGKDRLKALQHELGCKNGLIKAGQSKLQANVSTGECQRADVEMNLVKLKEEDEPTKECRDCEKPQNTKRKLRSQSLGSSESVQSEIKKGNKGSIVRRQSARFKAAQSIDAEDLCKTDDAKFRECSESVPENGPTCANIMPINESNDNGSVSSLKRESQELGRSSLCRPSRSAAKKVQSYKEIPLNVKMRRPE